MLEGNINWLGAHNSVLSGQIVQCPFLNHSACQMKDRCYSSRQGEGKSIWTCFPTLSYWMELQVHLLSILEVRAVLKGCIANMNSLYKETTQGSAFEALLVLPSTDSLESKTFRPMAMTVVQYLNVSLLLQCPLSAGTKDIHHHTWLKWTKTCLFPLHRKDKESH